MVERDGIKSSEANADYFEKTLPAMAVERTQGQPFATSVLGDLRALPREALQSLDRDVALVVVERGDHP